MPTMILTFAEIVKYLKHKVLGLRLLEITFLAVSQLRRGIKGEVLFGWQLDSIKFHEACTAFAVAAVANNDENSALIFAQGISLYGGLNRKVVQVLKSKGHGSVDIYLDRVVQLTQGGKVLQANQTSRTTQHRIMENAYRATQSANGSIKNK